MRLHSAQSASQAFRGVLLLVALVVLSGTQIKSADGQFHNVDGTFLVDARINGTPAVLLLDTGAERSLLDRKFKMATLPMTPMLPVSGICGGACANSRDGKRTNSNRVLYALSHYLN
jgi:hypothetical protein